MNRTYKFRSEFTEHLANADKILTGTRNS